MPFKNEHAARIRSASGFDKIRRVVDLDDGVDAIVGIKDGKSRELSIRFDKTKYSVTQAKAWLRRNNYEPILFEPARRDNNMPYHDEKEMMPKEDKEMGAHLDKEKEMGAHEDKDKEMGAHEEEKEMDKHDKGSRVAKGLYALEDLYMEEKDAEEAAEKMGISGSHAHVHEINDKEVTFYMPGRNHEEYMEAKKKMEDMAAHEDEKEMGKDKEKEMGAHDKDEKEMMDHGKKKKDEEEEMSITAKDVHIDKPLAAYSKDVCDCEEQKENCDCDEVQKNNAIEQTFNINGVEIFSTGVWNGDRYTQKDLDSMIKNFDEVGFEPPVKLGHNDEQTELKDGQPALGYIDKIYKVETKLVADFKELPKKVYEAIKRGNYKRVSSEIFWNYKANGNTFNRVLKAVALLGAEVPAVTNLQSMTGLYSNMGTGEVKTYYDGKESEIMEESKTISVEKYEEEISQLRAEKEEVMKEYQAHKDEIKKENISKYIEELKTEGKILPIQYKEVEALLSTATEEKVFTYSKEDKEVELSQFELVRSILDNMPKVVEFAEISESIEEEVLENYDNAGAEVDRRAKLYVSKGKAKDYSEALKLVLEGDKTLADKYEEERR